MFQQTDAYSTADQLTLSPTFKPPSVNITSDGVYRFFWAHGSPNPVSDGCSSVGCEFVANTQISGPTVNVGSAYCEFSPTTVLSSVSLGAGSGNVGVAKPKIVSYQNNTTGDYGTGTGYSIMDGTTNYVPYSETSGILNSSYVSSAWCIGKLSVKAGAKITNLVYLFASDSTNYRKKCKNVTLYYSATGVAGTFGLVQKWATAAPTVNGPWSETLTLTTPLTLNGSGNDYVQIVVDTAWGNQGYIWCSEVQIVVQN